MKVFELMNQLSDMPAGADVKIGLTMTVDDLIKNGVADTIDGKAFYHFEKDITETEENTVCGNTAVFLYD